jgi:hypothetical protein
MVTMSIEYMTKTVEDSAAVKYHIDGVIPGNTKQDCETIFKS